MCHLFPVHGNDVVIVITECYAFHVWRHVQHVVMLRHLVTAHSRKHSNYVWLVGTDDEVIALLGYGFIRCHVFLMQLFLIRNGYNDVAVTFLNS